MSDYSPAQRLRDMISDPSFSADDVHNALSDLEESLRLPQTEANEDNDYLYEAIYGKQGLTR